MPDRATQMIPLASVSPSLSPEPLANGSSPPHQLAGAFALFLAFIVQLRSARAFGAARALRTRARSLLDGAAHAARESGASEADCEAASFAVVAFLDETIQEADWDEKEVWLSRPLQLELYDRYDAGEEFFVRLASLRRDPDANASVLHIYYLCLALGFRGQYQLQHDEPLAALRAAVRNDLQAVGSAPARRLAPAPPREPDRGTTSLQLSPLRVAAVTILALAILYLSARVTASEAAQRAVRQLTDPDPVETVGRAAPQMPRVPAGGA